MLQNSTTRIFEKCKEKGIHEKGLTGDCFFSKLSSQESCAFVRAGRTAWEKGICGEIEAIGLETKKKFVVKK